MLDLEAYQMSVESRYHLLRVKSDKALLGKDLIVIREGGNPATVSANLC
jgi:hypothetical protein